MEPTKFERVTFATLVPAVAAPFGGALGMYVMSWTAGNDFGLGIGLLASAVLLLVLFGSMTFNAWVLLRRARTWQSRSIPGRVGSALLVLYSTLLLWFLVGLIPGAVAAAVLVFGPAVAIESIVVLSVIGSTAAPREPGVSELTLGPRARWWVLVYLVVAAMLLLGSVAGYILPDAWPVSSSTEPLAILLGLPWSPALTVVNLLQPYVGLGTFVPVLAVPLIANIALAAALLATPRSQSIALRVLFIQRAKQDTRVVDEDVE